MIQKILNELLKIQEEINNIGTYIDVEYICFECGYHGTENERIDQYTKKTSKIIQDLITDLENKLEEE